jgi:hypothetical protein
MFHRPFSADGRCGRVQRLCARTECKNRQSQNSIHKTHKKASFEPIGAFIKKNVTSLRNSEVKSTFNGDGGRKTPNSENGHYRELAMTEKREYLRLPIIHQIGEPIDMMVEGKLSQGVIIDLSAGGMLILGYANVIVNSEIKIKIDIKNLKTKNITGRAIWTKAEGNMYKTGIKFLEMDPVDFIQINRMGVDCNECDVKIASGVKSVCFSKCSFYGSCNKSHKIKFRKTQKNNSGAPSKK